MTSTFKGPPKLSIGIPVFNGENFLEELLLSLQKQTFDDIEIIISDNASTDRTKQVCLDYAERDPRIRYYRNARNIGANPNYNKVFALSRANLFKWAAHDDLYAPGFLEQCVLKLSKRPDAVLAYSDFLCIDEMSRPFVQGPDLCSFIDPRSGFLFRGDRFGIAEGRRPLRRFWEVLFEMYCSMQIFGVIRRESLRRTGLMRNFYGTDKVILAELALLGPFARVDEKLYLKRVHPGMSWALSVAEQRSWSGGETPMYSKRLRQLAAFSSAPFGKSLSMAKTGTCLAMVLLLGFKGLIRILTRDRFKHKVRITAWRQRLGSLRR